MEYSKNVGTSKKISFNTERYDSVTKIARHQIKSLKDLKMETIAGSESAQQFCGFACPISGIFEKCMSNVLEKIDGMIENLESSVCEVNLEKTEHELIGLCDDSEDQDYIHALENLRIDQESDSGLSFISDEEYSTDFIDIVSTADVGVQTIDEDPKNMVDTQTRMVNQRSSNFKSPKTEYNDSYKGSYRRQYNTSYQESYQSIKGSHQESYQAIEASHQEPYQSFEGSHQISNQQSFQDFDVQPAYYPRDTTYRQGSYLGGEYQPQFYERKYRSRTIITLT